MWFSLSSKARRKTSDPIRRQPLASRLVLELLEDRCLLSAPALGFSSYLPGTAYGTAVDSAGDTYVTGFAGNGSAFVCKVNPTGTALDYSTNLGSGWAMGLSIAVDSAGDACVMGLCGNSFPTTANAAFPTTSTAHNAFLAVLNPTGSGLLYSTYLPNGQGNSIVGYGKNGGIAVDSAGNAYVTGEAFAGFPTTANAYQTTLSGSSDAFFTEINPHLSGSASLVYSTLLGGSGIDAGTGIALDGSGNVYVTGDTTSSNFPTTAGAFQRTYGGSSGTGADGDAFVAKLNPALSGSASLVYSTYLGGSGGDGYVSDLEGDAINDTTQKDGPAIAVDSAGDAYVAGATSSTNFPTTAGALQATYHPGKGKFQNPTAAFVTEFNPTGSALVSSTYLGGSGSSDKSGATGIALDAEGNAYVTGCTRSTTFPLVNPLQSQKASGNDSYGSPNADVFVSTLNATGSALLFSTYLGGSGDDYGDSIAVNAAGDTFVSGRSVAPTSPNFPTTPGAFQMTPGPGFVFMIDPPVSGAQITAAASQADNNVVQALLQRSHPGNA